MVCLVSRDYRRAGELLQQRILRGIAGYIHPEEDDLDRQCKNLISFLARRISSLEQTLMIRSCGQELRIPYKDICMIETEKGSHFQNLVHLWGIFRSRLYPGTSKGTEPGFLSGAGICYCESDPHSNSGTGIRNP